MKTNHRALFARVRWLPTLVMLTVALLLVAAWLNGVGRIGVMSAASPGAGHFTAPVELEDSEEIAFARVDRAIERIDPDDQGHPDAYEAYEQVLAALAEALPDQPEQSAIRRAGFLLARSLPAPVADDIAGILPGYLRYHHAERGLLGLAPAGPGRIEGAYVRLQLQHALRRATLGEAATDRLYRTTQRMTEAHLVRQLLSEREDLDDSEKQRLIRQQMESLAAGSTGETGG